MRDLTAEETATVAEHYPDDLTLAVGRGGFLAEDETGSVVAYEPGDPVPRSKVTVGEFRAAADRLVLMAPDRSPAHGVRLSDVSATVRNELRALAGD